MDTVVLAARILLALVFAVAAVGKLADLPSSRASLLGFGVPRRAAAILGTILPFVELAVAVLLIPASTAVVGAIAAGALLLLFCCGIANAMRKGEAPPCNCFGAIHSEPAGASTLIRNIVLAGVAGVAAIWGPGPAVGSWVADRTAAELVAIGLGIGVIALLWLAIPALRENRTLRRDLDSAESRVRQIPPGLSIGSLAPDFSLPDGQGGELRLSTLLERGRPVVLVFTAAGCGPCDVILPELRHLQEIAGDRISVALLGISSILRYEAVIERHGGEFLLIDAIKEDPGIEEELAQLREVMHAYDVHHSPAAVVVSPSGTIASAAVDGRPAIEALIRLTLAGSVAPAPVSLAPVAA